MFHTINSSLRLIQTLSKTFPNLVILAKSFTGRFKCPMVTMIKCMGMLVSMLIYMFKLLLGGRRELGGIQPVFNASYFIILQCIYHDCMIVVQSVYTLSLYAYTYTCMASVISALVHYYISYCIDKTQSCVRSSKMLYGQGEFNFFTMEFLRLHEYTSSG